MRHFRAGLLPALLTISVAATGCQAAGGSAVHTGGSAGNTGAGAVHTASPGGGDSATYDPALCRFVTADEMAKVTGVPQTKPIPRPGQCYYVFDPAFVFPSFNPAAAVIPSPPPSISLMYDEGSTIIDAFAEDRKNPRDELVDGLGAPAQWYELDSGPDALIELEVRLPRGVVRIDIIPPDPPQKLSTGNKDLAIAIFKIAKPRLP
jgi:hypothetical protein